MPNPNVPSTAASRYAPPCLPYARASGDHVLLEEGTDFMPAFSDHTKYSTALDTKFPCNAWVVAILAGS
eukprot:1171644-Pleurochrysis_carterae.AAC.1